ncbi:MAG: sigma-70 family RNA polymerase sigma factor [Candidatus Dormibacteraeota bacterium]|nr:sigma-70 family RNA polymerase sigma factor [Candidatus Dormibacteraeota bacterium]
MGSGPSEGLAYADFMAGLVAGSHEALAELYDRYSRLAYAVALRVLGDPSHAQDAVQEAFLKIWNNPASFDVRRGSLRSWLRTAVRT